MLKILEALAALLLHKISLHDQAHKEPGLGIEFLMTKGRTLMIGIFLSIVVAILLSVGISMSVVGASLFYADATNSLSHSLMINGLITSVVCVGLASFGFSKKRFQIDEPSRIDSKLPIEHNSGLTPKPAQIIEEVIVAVIKNFLKEQKDSKTAALKTPT